MIPRIVILFFLLIAVAAKSAGVSGASDAEFSESSTIMRTWHVADGLPSDYVTAVRQTHDGFLWIATSDGLVRFDGVKFAEGCPPNFPTNELNGLTALCEDSHGYLWIGTQHHGLFKLAEGALVHYGTAEGFLNESVTSLTADERGQVWIGGTAGLCRWNGNSFDTFNKQEGLPDEAIVGVDVAHSGTVWITTRTGMYQFVDGRIVPYAFLTDSQGRSPEYLGAYEDRSGNLWAFGDTYLVNLTEGKRFNYFRSSEPASVRIWSLCEGNDGRLWIGTSGRGLFCFQNNRFQPVVHGENRWPYDVRAICEDREGSLWLGTSGGGLVQLRLQSVRYWPGGSGLPESLPMALTLNAAGKMFAGLQRGGVWEGESHSFKPMGGGDRPALENFVSCLAAARDGTVWAGTLGNGLYGLRERSRVHLTSADGFRNNDMTAVCADGEGGIWASTHYRGVYQFASNEVTSFNESNGLPDAAITVMIPATTGGIWVGTDSGEVLQEQHGTFSPLAAAADPAHRQILALCEGESGRLWIGSKGGGLICANGTSVIKMLSDESVGAIVEDAEKNLWLGTDNGIYRVTQEDLKLTLANPDLPLAAKLISPAKIAVDPSGPFGGPRVLLSPDGYACFATSEGILNFDTYPGKATSARFPVFIESAILNNSKEPLPLLRGSLWPPVKNSAEPLLIPMEPRSLEVRFTALSFAAPREIQFRHKLDGFDLDWVNDAGARSVRYGKLSHGDYRFELEARAPGGEWNMAGNVFNFAIPTPFYIRVWAILLYVLFTILLIVWIARSLFRRRLRDSLSRLEQQQSLERERMRIARDMHDEIGSKLTKISFLSEHLQMDLPPSAPINEKVESIAQTSRDLLKTMDEIVWVVNPQNDTAENLMAYLSHYAMEYFQGTSVECELQLPKEVPDQPVSSENRHNLFLTFEETLNNVLKHSSATKVSVEISFRQRNFEIRISDNGVGFDMAREATARPEERTGNGLKNMRQRLISIGGECVVVSRVGGGTTVTIRAPLAHQTGRQS